jgi:hypothetical protein
MVLERYCGVVVLDYPGTPAATQFVTPYRLRI